MPSCNLAGKDALEVDHPTDLLEHGERVECRVHAVQLAIQRSALFFGRVLQCVYLVEFQRSHWARKVHSGGRRSHAWAARVCQIDCKKIHRVCLCVRLAGLGARAQPYIYKDCCCTSRVGAVMKAELAEPAIEVVICVCKPLLSTLKSFLLPLVNLWDETRGEREKAPRIDCRKVATPPSA